MAIATIAEFLEPSLWVLLMYVYKRRRRDSRVNLVLGICLVEATRGKRGDGRASCWWTVVVEC